MHVQTAKQQTPATAASEAAGCQDAGSAGIVGRF
jgi:hypothetical protein